MGQRHGVSLRLSLSGASRDLRNFAYRATIDSSFRTRARSRRSSSDPEATPKLRERPRASKCPSRMKGFKGHAREEARSRGSLGEHHLGSGERAIEDST